MIQIGELHLNLGDPLVQAGLAAGGVLVVFFVLLVLTLWRTGRAARVAAQVGQLDANLKVIAQNQSELRGGLQLVSDTAHAGQAQLAQLLEQRLADVQARMQDSLHGSSKQTATSLSALQERLKAIDKAQDNITKLSGDVLGLQDILSNKQTRGAFGEIQLRDILSKALPPDSFGWQVTLSNGKRADCLIHLPNPPGPIVIDSKFPLEPYEALRQARTEWDRKDANAKLKVAVKTHIRAISEKYILEGETADGALMFLPSEAIYAELHANFPDLIQASFEARVWIVSPTTCMATLNTMRAVLKDARMREKAGEIRKMLGQLHRDVELVVARAEKLETHFDQARRDVEGLSTAAERAGKRAQRLENFEFEGAEDDGSPNVVSLTKPE